MEDSIVDSTIKLPCILRTPGHSVDPCKGVDRQMLSTSIAATTTLVVNILHFEVVTADGVVLAVSAECFCL